MHQNKTEHTTITYRDIKNLNKEQFIAALKEAPWDPAFIFDDPDDIVDGWYDIFQDVVDRFLPLKNKQVKHQFQPKWFNNHIVDGFEERDKLLNKAKKCGSDHDWLNYRRAKNYVTNLIKQTKQKYFKTKFTENKHNSRKLWNLIKCLSGNDGPEHKLQQLAEESEIIANKDDIAEILNCFFVDQQKHLTSQFGLNNDSSTGARPPPPPSLSQVSGTFNIPQISRDKVVNLLLSIPVYKATGNDGVSAKLLRSAAPAITDSLCKLINFCIDKQTFPTKWKVGKVTPIYKGQGNRDDKNNYRPIAVLPILSKLLEKHICDHLCDFLEENTLLHRFQSGFRKFDSTETALICLVDQLLFDLDKNRASGLVFIDYKKAFDLIDHGLLLEKLKAYGVRDNELELLRSYLSGRTQYVHINGCYSSSRSVSAGVPQGSILGPILFLLFINDLPSVAQHSTVDISADDTTLTSSSDVTNGLTAMSSALQQDLDDVSRWSAANKMVTNAQRRNVSLLQGNVYHASLTIVYWSSNLLTLT